MHPKSKWMASPKKVKWQKKSRLLVDRKFSPEERIMPKDKKRFSKERLLCTRFNDETKQICGLADFQFCNQKEYSNIAMEIVKDIAKDTRRDF